MKKFILSFFFALVCFNIWAHPHIWVESSLALVVRDDLSSELQIGWSFDQMFTSIICEDYDLDKDGKLSKAEAQTVEEEAFINLQNFDFYSFIFVNGAKIPIEYRDFAVELIDGKIIYYFKIPFHLPKESELTVQFANYDPSIFTDLLLAEDPVVLLPSDYSYTMSYQSYQVLDEIEFPQMVKLEVVKK